MGNSFQKQNGFVSNVGLKLFLILLLGLTLRTYWVFVAAKGIPNALGGYNWAENTYGTRINTKDYRNPYGNVSPDFNQCYDPYAQSLLLGKGFADREGKPTAFVAPLYSVFLALIYSIWGRSLDIIRLSQIILDIFSCLLIFNIAGEMFNKRVAIFASLFYSIYPLLVYQTGLVLSETLFIFFLVSFSYLLLKVFSTSGNKVIAFLCGTILGLAVLTRPIPLLLPVIIIPGLLYHYRYKKTLALSKSIYIMIGMSIVVIPWIIRNYFIFHKFIPVSSIIYYFYEDPSFTASEYSIKTGIYDFIIQKMTNFFNDPIQRLFHLIYSMFSVWYKTHSKLFDKYIFFINYPILILSICGMFLGFKKYRNSFSLILILFYYFIALMVISKTVFVRYVVPMMPFLLIFSAFAVLEIYGKTLQVKRKAKTTII
jgi:4-amino-4-deoxy-L-arabinose transferase-like glycosyltransferase